MQNDLCSGAGNLNLIQECLVRYYGAGLGQKLYIFNKFNLGLEVNVAKTVLFILPVDIVA